MNMPCMLSETRQWIPDMLRPSATLAASLLSSPSTVRLVSVVLSRVKPSAEDCTGWTGQGLGAAGVPTSSMALIMVTEAPAVNAWPAGDEGCDGDPPADNCGRK